MIATAVPLDRLLLWEGSGSLVLAPATIVTLRRKKGRMRENAKGTNKSRSTVQDSYSHPTSSLSHTRFLSTWLLSRRLAANTLVNSTNIPLREEVVNRTYTTMTLPVKHEVLERSKVIGVKGLKKPCRQFHMFSCSPHHPVPTRNSGLQTSKLALFASNLLDLVHSLWVSVSCTIEPALVLAFSSLKALHFYLGGQ